MLKIRRGYPYPSADIVTGAYRVDACLDAALLALGVNRHRPRLSAPDPCHTVAVIGFPRSGNTFLEAWLRRTALPGVTVLDGRVTHSVLDAYRLARVGTTVVVPIRPPLATCASKMVRADRFDDVSYAKSILRAYTAWYRSAARIYRSHDLRVLRFADFTSDPMRVPEAARLHGLCDACDPSTAEEFPQILERELREIPGQGQDLEGTPSHQMLSIPHPDRQPLLARAEELLEDSTLARQRERAVAAYLTLDALTVAPSGASVH